jgi:hypothetical protein
MFTFLIILILVFVGVDLLVRFVIDPVASGRNKKQKLSKSFSPRFDPTIKLASETMYDGGRLHNEDQSDSTTKDDNLSEEADKRLER